MDTSTQIVLLLMTIALGSTLVVAGIMLIFVLKDLRDSLARVNNILDDVEEVTSRASEGSELIEDMIITLNQIVREFKDKAASPLGSVLGLVSMFSNRRKSGGKRKKGGESYG